MLGCSLDYDFHLRRQGAGPAPAVRQSSDVEHLFEDEGESQGRSLLTCCVRLSAEKEPDRFVALVEALGASALRDLQVRCCLLARSCSAYWALRIGCSLLTTPAQQQFVMAA